MRLPTWDELASVEEQLEVLEYPLDESLFVAGPPGSGKTVLAVHRAKMTAELGAAQPVAMITFNRMLRRMLSLVSNSSVSADTMHSFVWGDYKARMNANPPQINDFVNDWNSICNNLKEKSAVPTKSHLVVDEGQDLPRGFFTYASRYVSLVMTVFADEDQALDDQRTTLEQIKGAAGLGDPVILKHNHRNTPEIALMAEHFHSGRLPAARVVRPNSGNPPRIVQSPSLESTAELVSNWHRNRGGSVGIIVNRNSTGDEMYNILKGKLKETRIDIYDHERRNENTINLLTTGITILNRSSIKGQEFDAVFIMELERFIPCKSDAENRVMYMMCTRARDFLFLIYGPNNLSPEAGVALPGPDILDRA